MSKKKSSLSVKLVWDRAAHSAFTDLCEFNQYLYCCFREASNHVSADGVIRLLKLDQHDQLLSHQRIWLPDTDLRDPKLSVAPDGKLMLLAYARQANKSNKTTSAKPMLWFSSDGYSWSSGKELGHEYWWLWRIRWHQQRAYGFAYNRAANCLRLYAGNPLRSFHILHPEVLSLQKHGLGYPNESDLTFTSDEQAFAIVRRDADSFSAQLGLAKPPYTQWQWHDLGEYIGGPVMLNISDHQAIVAGRIYRNGKLNTAIWLLNLSSKRVQLKQLLPSAGDNSYPGMVLHNNKLILSYYSSHQQKKSCIYLARINLSELL